MKKNATHYIESLESEIVFANPTLDGVKILYAEKITTTYNVTRNLRTKTVVRKIKNRKVKETVSFDLTPVTVEELANIRRKQIPSFVLKTDGKLYWAEVPKAFDLKTARISKAHQCAFENTVCNRLSGKSDENGGCAKVRDKMKRIEKYPFIKKGFETFNTAEDAFIVTACSNYERCSHSKGRRLSLKELNSLRLGLAQFVWEDVTSREEVEKRVKRNFAK